LEDRGKRRDILMIKRCGKKEGYFEDWKIGEREGFF
jgi:hypothetical protein